MRVSAQAFVDLLGLEIGKPYFTNNEKFGRFVWDQPKNGTTPDTLKLLHVYKHLSGITVLGTARGETTRALIIDLDAKTESARFSLRARLDSVIAVLGKPSLLTSSSGTTTGGIHATYLLPTPTPTVALNRAITGRLRDAGVEVKPGWIEVLPEAPTKNVRLPLGRGSHTLHPERLTPLPHNPGSELKALLGAPRYTGVGTIPEGRTVRGREGSLCIIRGEAKPNPCPPAPVLGGSGVPSGSGAPSGSGCGGAAPLSPLITRPDWGAVSALPRSEFQALVRSSWGGVPSEGSRFLSWSVLVWTLVVLHRCSDHEVETFLSHWLYQGNHASKDLNGPHGERCRREMLRSLPKFVEGLRERLASGNLYHPRIHLYLPREVARVLYPSGVVSRRRKQTPVALPPRKVPSVVAPPRPKVDGVVVSDLLPGLVRSKKGWREGALAAVPQAADRAIRSAPDKIQARLRVLAGLVSTATQQQGSSARLAFSSALLKNIAGVAAFSPEVVAWSGVASSSPYRVLLACASKLGILHLASQKEGCHSIFVAGDAVVGIQLPGVTSENRGESNMTDKLVQAVSFTEDEEALIANIEDNAGKIPQTPRLEVVKGGEEGAKPAPVHPDRMTEDECAAYEALMPKHVLFPRRPAGMYAASFPEVTDHWERWCRQSGFLPFDEEEAARIKADRRELRAALAVRRSQMRMIIYSPTVGREDKLRAARQLCFGYGNEMTTWADILPAPPALPLLRVPGPPFLDLGHNEPEFVLNRMIQAYNYAMVQAFPNGVGGKKIKPAVSSQVERSVSLRNMLLGAATRLDKAKLTAEKWTHVYAHMLAHPTEGREHLREQPSLNEMYPHGLIEKLGDWVRSRSDVPHPGGYTVKIPLVRYINTKYQTMMDILSKIDGIPSDYVVKSVVNAHFPKDRLDNLITWALKFIMEKEDDLRMMLGCGAWIWGKPVNVEGM